MSNAVNGTVFLDVNNNPVFLPNELFQQQGTASFMYTIQDQRSGRSSAVVNILDTNQAPIALDDVIDAQGVQNITIPAATLLANDSDPEGSGLSLIRVDQAVNGSVFLNVDNDPTFVASIEPGLNQVGSFVYTVADTQGRTATASVQVNLNGVSPIPADDLVNVAATEASTILAADLLSNDFEPQGETLSLSAVSGAVNGSVALDANGDVVFTPDAIFTETTEGSFVYTVTDPQNNTADAVVTVKHGNQDPVPAADRIDVPAGETLLLNSADLLLNDVDPEGEALTVTGVEPPGNNTVSFDATTGQIAITPSLSQYPGTFSFTYFIADPQGGTANGSVDVTVIAPLATAIDDSLSLPFNMPVSIFSSNLLGNDLGESLVLDSSE